MLPPLLAPPLDAPPAEGAAPPEEPLDLAGLLLLHAASTPALAASPATPAAPFNTERRLGSAPVAGDGADWLSRMAASIAAQTVSDEIHQDCPQPIVEST